MRVVSVFALVPFLTIITLGCSSDPGGSGVGERTFAPGYASPAGVSYALIGASGGQISDGSSTLEVPPGALTEPVKLTLERYADGERAVTRISPEGLRFARPALLRLAVPAEGSSSLWKVLKFDAGTGSWVNIGGTVSAGIVTTPIMDGTRYQVDIIG